MISLSKPILDRFFKTSAVQLQVKRVFYKNIVKFERWLNTLPNLINVQLEFHSSILTLAVILADHAFNIHFNIVNLKIYFGQIRIKSFFRLKKKIVPLDTPQQWKYPPKQ